MEKKFHTKPLFNRRNLLEKAFLYVYDILFANRDEILPTLYSVFERSYDAFLWGVFDPYCVDVGNYVHRDDLCGGL